jgi:glycerophosphoryl diester phosphodiesterase
MLKTRTRIAIRLAADDIRAAFLPLLGFDLIVAAVSALVFTPLIAWLFRRFVASTGKSVLSDMEIAGFLLSPFGIAALVLLLVVFLAFTIVFSAGFMHILLGQIKRGQPSILSTLVATLRQLPQIAGLIAIMVGAALAIAVPFLVGTVLFALPLITEFDINFYLAERPPEFVRAIAIAGGLLFVPLVIYLYLFVGWSFAIPLLLFRGLSPRESLKESMRLVAGRRKEIGLIILSWILTVVVITVVLGLFGNWFVGLLMSFQSSIAITVVLMGFVMLVNGFVSLAVSFITLTSLNAIIVRFYLDIAGDSAVTTISGEGGGDTTVWFWQLPRAVWWSLGVAAIAVVAGSAGYLLKDIDLEADVLVIAHRGSSLAAPENTMAAVGLGLEESADYIEIDVQENADGTIVVLHDADLKRVAGLDRAIADITRLEARDIDIGSWFDAEFSGERIPLLQDVLDATDGKAGVNIELKFTKRAVELTQRVLDVVKASGAGNRVEYMSLSYDGTQEIKQLAPDATVGFLSNVSIGNLVDTNVDFLAVSSRAATRNLIGSAQDAGMLVYVWTVNTPREMALFIDRGVDGIITDVPQLLNDVVAELNDASLAERLLLRFSNEIGLELVESEQ